MGQRGLQTTPKARLRPITRQSNQSRTAAGPGVAPRRRDRGRPSLETRTTTLRTSIFRGGMIPADPHQSRTEKDTVFDRLIAGITLADFPLKRPRPLP
jgi:hypothetical protein